MIDPSVIVPARQSAVWRWDQDWRDVFFAHWRTPPEHIQAHLPPEVVVETWHDSAWVSAVAFRLATRLIGWPAIPLCSNLLELNLRTYVCCHGKPAVWFLSMHGSRRLAVWLGRRLTPLPYTFAHIGLTYDGEGHGYCCGAADRPLFSARFRPIGLPTAASDHSLDAWLLERYRAIVLDHSGRLLSMTVEHSPWRVHSAIARTSARALGRDWGIDLDRPPDLVHFSEGVSALVGPFEPLT